MLFCYYCITNDFVLLLLIFCGSSVGLQCMIVVFSDHAHLHFETKSSMPALFYH